MKEERKTLETETQAKTHVLEWPAMKEETKTHK